MQTTEINENNNVPACSIPLLMRKYGITWKGAEKMMDLFYEEEGIIFEKDEG